MLRSCLTVASERGYDAFVTDVKNAFLRASIPEHVRGKILLRPPKILETMGITVPNEMWAIQTAVYGLRQSPKWWSTYRDRALAGGIWTGSSGRVHLEQSRIEPNLWKLVGEDGRLVGFMIVYVDDVMFLTSRSEAEAAHRWLLSLWECTPLDAASEESPAKFLGVDVHVAYNSRGMRGFSLGQEGYIRELLRSYDIEPRAKTSPVPREWVKDLPEEETFTQDDLRKAQKITGELLWLAQRTRVDIAYIVALMGSWCTKSPRFVLKIGIRVLEYVGHTADLRLSLIPLEGSEQRVVTYTDASFSPYGGHSISGIVIEYRGCPILWKGKRQGLVSLSTAESELISACEGITLTMSIEALLLDLVEGLLTKKLLVDNTAAICLAEGNGTTRTRHLRVRSNFVRDMLDRKELLIEHCPGDIQLADALTKILPGPRHSTLTALLGLGSPLIRERVATVASAHPGSMVRVSRPVESLLVLVVLLQFLEGESADAEEERPDPLSLDLYVMMLLFIFSILFLWESSKHCMRFCCRAGQPDEVRVSMINADDEAQVLKKERRRDAVRRAIEREAEGLRNRRVSESAETRDSPTSDARTSVDISVNVGTTDVAKEVLREVARGSSDGFRPPSPPPPPPPIGSAPDSRFTSKKVEVGSREGHFPTREVGTQTDFYQGLSYTQMCDLHLLTTSSRSSGAIHIFPNCHALRNVAGVQDRMFCRYCITEARQGF